MTPDNRGWSVSLSQTLYNHANYQNYKISKLQVLQSEAEYTTAYQDFILRVANAYFNVLGAKDSLLFSEAEEKAIQRQLDPSWATFEVGLAAITDVHEARARYDGRELLWLLLRNLLDDANEGIIWNVSSNITPSFQRFPMMLTLWYFQLKTMDAYQELALAQNPDLMVAKVSDISEKQIGVKPLGTFSNICHFQHEKIIHLALILFQPIWFEHTSSGSILNPVTKQAIPIRFHWIWTYQFIPVDEHLLQVRQSASLHRRCNGQTWNDQTQHCS